MPDATPEHMEPRPLSDLEKDVLWHLAQGKSGLHTARDLSISEATMQRVLRRARAALGATNTANAVYLAVKSGQI